MKKLMVLLLALAMLFTVSACKGSGNNGGSENDVSQNEVQQPEDSETNNTEDEAAKPEVPDEEDQDTADKEENETDAGKDEETTDGADENDAEEDKKEVRASHSDVTLKAAGNSFTLQVEGMEGVYALTYTSADPSIATVNEKGLVSAVAPGTTTVSVHVEGDGGPYDFNCIVRCNWKTENTDSNENGAGDDSAAAGSVDLTAFYNDMTSQYEFQTLQAFTGDVLESYYPGMGAVSTKQCLIMGTMMTMNNGEFCLVEVSDSKDVETVKSIFQSRIDYMAGGGAWYPGPTDTWTNNSRVVSNGNYVMMVVHESCDDIVEAFNALFA